MRRKLKLVAKPGKDLPSMSHQPQNITHLALLLFLVGLGGCASMQPLAKREVEIAGQPTAQCTVEFRPAGKSPNAKNIEIPADATVEQVLNQCGARRKFSRMKIDLYRQLPDGKWHKMPVEYDIASKRVDPIHDYSIHRGDRLVITEDTSGMWDDMATSTSGPLSIFGS